MSLITRTTNSKAIITAMRHAAKREVMAVILRFLSDWGGWIELRIFRQVVIGMPASRDDAVRRIPPSAQQAFLSCLDSLGLYAPVHFSTGGLKSFLAWFVGTVGRKSSSGTECPAELDDAIIMHFRWV